MLNQNFTFLSAHEDEENPNHMNLVFADLGAYEFAADDNAAAFDALVAGTFKPMFGGEVTITDADIKKIARNTNRLIKSTRGESGELAGIPIDTEWHNHDGEAGWMVKVAVKDGRLRATPQWTDIGQMLLESKRRKFFSASIDRQDMVMFGGTLTNYPATRDGNKKILLRPIELSMPAGEGITPLLSVHFAEADEADAVIEGGNAAESNEEFEMDPETLAALAAQITDSVNAGVEARFAELNASMTATPPASTPAGTTEGEGDETPPALDIISLLGLDTSKLDEKAALAMEEAMAAQHAELTARVEREWMGKLAVINRKRDIASFVTMLTNPAGDRTTGLSEDPANLQTALLALPTEQYAYWHDLLERAANGNSFVEFAEKGHSKKVKGSTQLPTAIAKDLDAGDLTVAQLSNPILGLGDLADYDLSKWQD